MTADADDFADERLPYWTELWPASVALADWLALRREEIVGRPCLDLGCGLGLTAMVGQGLGARVTAVDYEEEALRFARKNAATNGVPQPFWRRPAVAAGCMARVWGGDIMYEKRFVAPVLHFLDRALAPDGAAWVAEPGRTVYEAFLCALHNGGWQGRQVFSRVVEPIYARARHRAGLGNPPHPGLTPGAASPANGGPAAWPSQESAYGKSGPLWRVFGRGPAGTF